MFLYFNIFLAFFVHFYIIIWVLWAFTFIVYPSLNHFLIITFVFVVLFLLFWFSLLDFLIGILINSLYNVVSNFLPILFIKFNHFPLWFGIKRPVWWLNSVSYTDWFTKTCPCSGLFILIYSKAAWWISKNLSFLRDKFS